MNSISNHLDRLKLFDGISLPSKELLTTICSLKEFEKKAFLFHEGDQGTAIYFLVSGNIQLHKTSADGKEIVVKIVQPGELFAEVILFEKDRYPVTAVAIDQSQALIIPKSGMNQLLEDKKFRNDFIAVLMKKQRYLASRIHYLSSSDLDERFRMFLKEHFGTTGRIQCHFAKKDIAAAIGATPESLSRLLLRLKQQKQLTWEADIIEVCSDFWPDDENS